MCCHYTSFQVANDLNTIPEDYNVECQLLTGTYLIHQCEILFVQNILVPVFFESHHSRHLVKPPGKINCKYTSGRKAYFINTIMTTH